ncbi:MAG: SDR family oxidoreductase [Candidatus Eisenbacteria bacterium]|uniref:SDR family oxidoreductase n=1 Tax=Eiseniibacteriota bacterium TaxID=2212470 RepID=A0A538SG91_UNCEI|nr:MAG: SDR family oxidoreductase [Candidatus Eisenbacteria bacterium]
MTSVLGRDAHGFRLDDRVALITGGAGLLGWEHGMVLADQGARVVLADRRDDECRLRAENLRRRTGVPALGLACDVTNRASWESILHEVVSSFGRIDVLVNNAALTMDSRSPHYDATFSDFPTDDWNAVLAVNLTGTFLGCQVIGKHMVVRGSGSIINIASLYGVVSPHHPMYEGTGVHQPAAYAVSKAGVLGLTRYLAALWAPHGVRVNAITPGGVFNQHAEPFVGRYARLSPIGRMAQPEEIRGAVAYLASDASSYCTGHNLVVDGGWTAW